MQNSQTQIKNCSTSTAVADDAHGVITAAEDNLLTKTTQGFNTNNGNNAMLVYSEVTCMHIQAYTYVCVRHCACVCVCECVRVWVGGFQ